MVSHVVRRCGAATALLVAVAASASAGAVASSSQGPAATQLGLWPAPVDTTAAFDGCISLGTSSTFTFAPTGPGAGSAVLTGALARYLKLVFLVPGARGAATAAAAEPGDRAGSAQPAGGTDACKGSIKALAVNVASAVDSASLGVDESYNISVADGAATLSAVTVIGALRGLETFSQLASRGADGGTIIAASSVTIKDAPRFSHRGLLIDTGRHFLPVPLIHAALDAMAYHKLNVLHWHAVDDQAFPIAFPETAPLLAAKGAFSPKHVYSPADVADVLAYARARGIRVIPEFDMPGHSLSWGKGYPSLLTSCPSVQEHFTSPMDPSQEATYAFVDALWAEVAAKFEDDYVHLGGDEVNAECWQDNANVTAWMKHNNISSYTAVQAAFEKRVIESVTAAPINRSVIVWEEVFVNRAGWAMPPATVVEIWKERGDDKSVLEQAVKAGYRVVWTSPSWYLDYQLSGTRLSSDWTFVYGLDPVGNASLTPAEEAFVVGGEVCMWAPMEDATNFLSVVFPRASAAAERLWSPKTVTDVDDATTRLHVHRCRNLDRGIGIAPVAFASFCPTPFDFTYAPPF